MKKNIFLSLSTALFLASCAPKDNNNNETSIHARADSMVGVRMQDINQQAMESLEQRIAVEVKAKADSIVTVRTEGLPAPAKKDTVALRRDTLSRRMHLPMPIGSSTRSNDATKR